MSGIDRVYGLIGLAKRAGQLVDGQERILQAVTARKAKLVIVTEDAGANGRKKLQDKANSYDVPVVTFADKGSLGRAIGRDEAAAIAVMDPGFADKLLERFGELHGGGAFDESPSL
ncbi:L7Ae/L30e/S12e/Gadd45 family ribosomal protein [Alicyclobacillus dauci]|uniref:Ribosomal L7Ae/L30e/S12e/Gadd45 family protein n=1 Tax=Alicyclobacillus dauci TaxID=1475485 RepID=A0ABY6YXM6_9BACL|nr:ribosomal L7Ae/L30e/S12e/Gadd45 family protein [Alicyclobacillus dauci]WAH35367.1 ribosomal L7Ae/L30e/S12e/Gadd45 family protein [Alicyclobacillus dauci]